MPIDRQIAVKNCPARSASFTFAISPQLLPASRICFNSCSSAAVQGVLVRPFFFTPSGDTGCAEVDSAAVATAAAELLPSPGTGGLVSDPAESESRFWEARRFLGLEGEGGSVESVVAVVAGRGGAGDWTGAGSGGNVDGEVEEADSFCRFCDGGDLVRLSVFQKVCSEVLVTRTVSSSHDRLTP